MIKRIWNFFFGKKVKREPWMTDKVIEMAKESVEDFKQSEKPKKTKPHTQLFRNQQLPGKIYNIGKSRFRIKKKSGESGEKLKYDIQLLT